MKIRPTVISFSPLMICFCLIIMQTLLPCLKVLLPNYMPMLLLFASYFYILIIAVLDARMVNTVFRILLMSSFIGALLYWGEYRNTYGFLTSMYIVVSFFFTIIIGLVADTISEKSKNKLFDIYVLFESFTATTTVIGLTRYPEAARFLAFDSIDSDFYIAKNIGGYSFIYMAVIFFPYLVYKAKKAENKRMLYYFAIIINVLAIIRSQYSIAIIMLFVCVGMLIYTKRKVVGVLLTFLIPFLLLFGAPILIWLLNNARNSSALSNYSYLIERIDELIFALTYQRFIGDSASRFNLYQRSIDAFLHNPFFGALFSNQRLGGHSTLFDSIGATGMLGFSFIVLLIKNHLQYILGKFQNTIVVRYIRISVFVFIILSIVNTTLFSSIGLVIFAVPLLIVNTFNTSEKTTSETNAAA